MKTACDRRSRTRGCVVGLGLGKYAFVGGGVISLLAGPVFAGPEGAQVAAGSASFSKHGNTTVIEASHNAIINYNSFNIGSHEAVQFIQPGAASRVLNRINSPAPTQIDGSLTSNGIVYLVNPAGVMFGNNAVINVGGIYAAAGNISDANFLANVDHFTNLKGSVVNDGAINAGVAHFIGRQVANNGVVLASDAMTMVAGDDVYIGKHHDRIMVKVNAATDAAAVTPVSGTGVSNTGTVRAGRVTMAAGDVYSLAIGNTGRVAARDIQVRADGAGQVNVSGTLDASSAAPGQTGGRVEVLGGKVALSGATVDASGAAGGGTVLVGGDFQGKGEVPTATQTFISRDTTIRADATSAGDGGRVIVWSDDRTGYAGHISARGAAGGEGGFAEVSGKQTLNFQGTADLGSDGGRGGSLLLDPQNIIIANGGGGALADADTFAEGAASDVTIAPSTITAVTNTGTAVTLQASQDITVNNAVVTNNPGGNGGDLTLQAGRSILINANITTDNGNLTLRANEALAAGVLDADRGAGDAVITMSGATINTGSGNLSVSLGDGAGLTNFGSGDITFLNVTTTGVLSATNTGTSAGSGIIFSNSITGPSSIIAMANDGVTVSADMTASGPIVLSADANADGAGLLSLGNNVDIAAGNNPLSITTAGFDLPGSGNFSFSSGTALTTISGTRAEGMGLGGAPVTDGVNLTDAQVDKVTAGTLAFTSDGPIQVAGLTPAGVGGSVSFVSGSSTIAFTGTSTFNSVQATAAGDISIDGTLTANGASGTSSFDTDGAFAMAATGTLASAGTQATITADSLALAAGAAINAGSGTVVLQPQAAGAAIGVGAAPVGGFGVSQADLAAITTTGAVFIGRAGGTHTFAIGDNEAIDLSAKNYDLLLRGSGAATFTNNGITGSDNRIINFATGAVTGLAGGPSVTIGGTTGTVRFNTTGAVAQMETAVDRLGMSAVDGSLSIVNDGAIALDATTVTGAMSIVAGGEITDSGTLTIGGASSFTTRNDAGAAITLDETGSLFGSLTLRTLNLAGDAIAAGNVGVVEAGQMDIGLIEAGGNVSLVAAGPMDIGATTVGGTASFAAGGDINDSGAISVAGATAFKTLNDAGASITLDGTTSTFGALTLASRNAADDANRGGSITVFEDGAMDLAGVRTTGAGTFTATGAITDSGTLTVGGATSFTTRNNAGAAITLDDTGSLFGALTVRALDAAGTANAAGNISVREAGQMDIASLRTAGSATMRAVGPMDIGATTVGGGGSFTADGAINDSGTISVAGAATFKTLNNAGAGITLDQAASLFGALTVQSRNAADSADSAGNLSVFEAGQMDLASVRTTGNASFQAAGPMDIGASTIGGNASFIATGAINDSGTIAVTGTALFETRNIAGRSITLDQPSSTFGAITANALTAASGVAAPGNIDIRENAAMDVAGITTSGTVALRAPDLNITGVVAGSGITLRPTDVASSIALNDATGDFSLSAAELALLNSTGTVTIGATGGTGAVAIGSAGAINLSGESFDVVLNGGDVTFTNGLVLRNNGQLTMNVGAIDGSNAATDVTIGGASGTIVFNASGAVDIDTSIAQLGATTFAGDVDLNNGATTLAITGAVDAGANSLVLTADSLDIGATLTGNGGITLRPFTAGRTIGINDAAGDFNITMADLANLVSTGVVTIGASNAGAVSIGSLGAVDLSGAAYDFGVTGGATTFASTLTLRDGGTLRLSTGAITSAASGLDVQIGGASTLLLTTTGAAGSSANPLSTDVATLGAGTLGGDLHLSNGATALAIGGAVDAGANAVAITADSLDISAGTIIGNGGITLRPFTAGRTIGINDAAGDFNLTLAELQNLSSTGRVAVGSADAGAVSIGSLGAVDLSGESYDLTIRGGAATFADTLSLRDNGTLRLVTGAITSAASGDDVVIGGASGTLLISTGGAAGSSANPLSTDVARLAAATAAGGVFVANAGGLTLTTVDGVAGALAGSGNVELSAAAGNLDAQTGATVTGAEVALSAPAGKIGSTGAVPTATSTLTASADSGIDISNTGAALTATINTATGLAQLVTSGTLATGGAWSAGSFELSSTDIDIAHALTSTAQTAIRRSGAGTVGLGDATGDMTISGDELALITSNGLAIGGGNVAGLTVDGITNAETATIAGTVTLVATAPTGTITFSDAASGAPSSFNTLVAIADGTIDVASAISTDVGSLRLTGGDILFAPGLTIDSRGDMILTAPDGMTGLGDLTLRALDSGSDVTLNHGLTSVGGLTVRAGRHVTLAGSTSTGGATILNADSDADGVGGLTVAATGSVSTGGRTLDIRAADVALDGQVHTGGAATNIRRSFAGTIGVGDAAGDMGLSRAELARITAGSLTVGGVNATAIDVDGVALSDVAAITGPVTLDAGGTGGVVQFSGADSAFNQLALRAIAGVSANAGITSNSLAVNADTDGAGGGVFSVAAGKTVSSGTGVMGINASDLTLDGSLSAGDLSITSSTNSQIVLGGSAAPAADRLSISDVELGRIGAATLALGSSTQGGTITVESVTTATGAASPSMVTLNATGTGSRILVTGPATFKALDARANNGIAVDADLTASIGAMRLNGDYNGGANGSDGIAIAAGRTLSSGGLMTLISATGGITAAGDLTISAGDLALLNALDAAGHNVTISRSGGGAIGLGDATGDMTISGAELELISADTLTLGGDSTTLITVDNVTAENSGNITGLLTLNATGAGGQVRFVENASVFSALAANADDGIFAGVNLSTSAGGLSLNGDADNAADGNDAVTIAGGVELGSGGALTVVAATGGVVLSGEQGTTNVLRATDDKALTLGSVSTTDNANLTVTSQGTIALSGVDLGSGDFSATADANSNESGITLTVDNITARDITLATGNDGNDTISIATDFAAGGNLTIRDAGVVELAGGVDLTAGAALNIASGIGTIRLTGGAGTINILSSGTENLVALGPVSTSGAANLTINASGDMTLASVNIGGGALAINLDNNNSGLNTGTVGSITAGSLLARALGGNDTLTFNGPITVSGAAGVNIDAGAAVLGGNITASAGDITLQGASVISADLTISTAAGDGDITFLGEVNGGNILTVNPGTGNAVFAAAVGGSTAVRGLVVPGSGSLRFESTVNIGDQGASLSSGSIRLASNFASVGDVSFSAPILLGNNLSITGNDLVFGSTINSEGEARSLSVNSTGNGVTTFAGVVGGLSPLSTLTTNADGTTRLNANVFTTAGMTFIDAVVLTADVLLRDVGPAGIAFGSTINSDSTNTPRSLTLLVPTDAGADPLAVEIPVISFGGNIGSTARLANLRLNVDAATGVDGRAAPTTGATIVARQLDANGLPVNPSSAAFNDSFAVSITTSGEFLMGLNEKFTSLGGLSITAGSAKIGDLGARGDLTVASDNITLRARAAGPVLNAEGLPDFDSGIDFVGRTINFTSTPVVEGVGLPLASFGTEDGTGDVSGTLSGFSFRSFGSVGARDMVLNNRVLDLRSAGPTNTNIAPTIAGAIPRENQSGDVSQDTTVGQAQQEQLTQLGVFARDLGLEELLTFLVGRSIYDDFPDRPNPDALAGDYRVAVNRLDSLRVEQLLRSYDEVFNRDAVDENGSPIVSPETGQRLRQPRTEEIREALQLAVRDFRNSGEERRDFDAVTFMAFLEESPDHAEALSSVQGLRNVFRQLSLIGLTPLEFNVAKATLLKDITPRGIRAAELEALLIESPSVALRLP